MSEQRQRPHIVLRGVAKAEDYSYAGPIGRAKELPFRDRRAQAEVLKASLDQARVESQARSERQTGARGGADKKGVHLEIIGEPGFELALKSLDSGGLQLVAVRDDPETPGAKRATVFVPSGKLRHLEKKIETYATADTKKGAPRHQRLLAPIASLRLAALRAFWTDEPSLFPQAGENLWWEIWLRSATR